MRSLELVKHVGRWRVLTAVLITCAIAEVAILAVKWPFTRQAIVRSLERSTASRVHVTRLKRTFFPRPGCVAEEVAFTRDLAPGSAPLATVRRLRFEGSWANMLTFRRELPRLRAEGLCIRIPHIVPPAAPRSS